MKTKENTSLIIAIIVLSLLVVGLSGFIIYDKALKNNDQVKSNKDDNSKNGDIQSEANKASVYDYFIYEENVNYYINKKNSKITYKYFYNKKVSDNDDIDYYVTVRVFLDDAEINVFGLLKSELSVYFEYQEYVDLEKNSFTTEEIVEVLKMKIENPIQCESRCQFMTRVKLLFYKDEAYGLIWINEDNKYNFYSFLSRTTVIKDYDYIAYGEGPILSKKIILATKITDIMNKEMTHYMLDFDGNVLKLVKDDYYNGSIIIESVSNKEKIAIKVQQAEGGDFYTHYYDLEFNNISL